MALNLVVKVHPVVLFQIVDAYERRNADSHRVIGTLLGNVDKGVVEVTNCFCVPHKEHADQVEAELNYAMDVYELNRRVNNAESIVGWWATGNEVTNHSSVIHEYYSRECNNPVHVTLDTSLQSARMGLRAYVCVALGVPRGKTGCMFTPINVEVTSYEPETVGLQLCQKTMGNPGSGGRSRQVQPMMDLAQVADASSKLAGLLDQVLKYVDDVLAEKQPTKSDVGRKLHDLVNYVPNMSTDTFTYKFNTAVLQYVDDVLAEKQPPNNDVGRKLLDLVNSVPNMSTDTFANMFNSNVKDLLMVVTLSQLIKTQLQLNEKLTLLTSQ